MTDEGINQLESDPIEQLRSILEQQQRQPISYDEASEVGRSLLTFYKALAGVA
jgi:hypothetical protein